MYSASGKIRDGFDREIVGREGITEQSVSTPAESCTWPPMVEGLSAGWLAVLESESKQAFIVRTCNVFSVIGVTKLSLLLCLSV